jgi:hypothetical protein
MNARSRLRVVSLLAVAATCFTVSRAQPAPLPDRPDPREIPLPKIKTALGDLPGPDQLPVRKEMPDPLVMNNGTKVTTPEQFKERQKEIRKILEYYHVGRLPPAPGNVKGAVGMTEDVEVNGKKYKYRMVRLTFGPDEKLTMDIGIASLAEGGPYPTVMQFGGAVPGGAQREQLPRSPLEGRGADILLPPEIALGAAQNAARGGGPTGAQVANNEIPAAGGAAPAPARGGFGRGPQTAGAFVNSYLQVLERGYAAVRINTNDCAEDTVGRLPDGSFAFRSTRFFPAYPGYDWGILGGWAWGAMRVVDYLQHDPVVDKTKLIITGTSRNGKAAMITGAFDDRIALVAPGASSGLGTPAYRFSGGPTTTQPSRGGREGLTMMVRKYGNQFSPHLHQFWGQEDKLPYDAHWFPALTAPRPWIALEGTHDQNVVHNGVKQTWLHARPVYSFLGVADKVGVYWADRPHGFGDTDWDGLLAFADKHLLGKRVSRAFDLFPATDEVPAK